MTPEVFDSAEAATLLRCAISTVEERARKGDLPGLKFGDGWIFPAQALVARLNQLALEEAARRRAPGTPSATATALNDKRPPRGRTPPQLPCLK